LPSSCRGLELDDRLEQSVEAAPAEGCEPPGAVYVLDFATVDVVPEQLLELGRVRDVGAADALLDSLEDAAVELADRQAGFPRAYFGETTRAD